MIPPIVIIIIAVIIIVVVIVKTSAAAAKINVYIIFGIIFIAVTFISTIAENKDELPIRFREVKNEYSVTLLGEVVIVDSELRHIIELIMNSDNLTEIMYYIQMYKKETSLIG